MEKIPTLFVRKYRGGKMKKIPTLFVREYEDHKVIGIIDKLTDPSLQVVLDGKCEATIKVDGSCCAIINSKFYKRYDAKKGKKPPAEAIPCQDAPDEITGHWPHWLEVNENKPEDKWYAEALKNYYNDIIEKTGVQIQNNRILDGTYEAIGPHFQGNPYNLKQDTLYKHGSIILEDAPNTFEGLKYYLKELPHEGIVFWYNGEPLCKIKRSDFGYEWPVKDSDFANIFYFI